MFDAYTARKAAPRIVLAVIGINLSIYLCLAAVDITNVIGHGMNDLITKPFIDAGNYDFGIAGLNSGTGRVEAGAGAAAGYGILVSAGGLGALFGGLMTLGAAPLATLGSLLILALPIMFTALAIMITIVIRQALLIFLTIVSPVAIACYVLPGTEKYFKQWFDLFTKTLLVYPIIAVIFAMSDVFGSIIFNQSQSGSGLTGFVKILTGIIVIYAPLVLIPFAFRFAGGAMGKLAAVATSGAGKVANMGPVKGRREIAKRDLGNQVTQNRSIAAGKFQSYASRSNSRVGRIAANRMVAGIGGYNIEAQSSARRAQTAKEINDQIATGRDDEIRGLTANMAAAEADWAKGDITPDSDGTRTSKNGLRRVTNNGTVQYKTLGGAWVEKSHVEAGQRRWGNDEYAQQAALAYEMRKAASDEEVAGISARYGDLAKNVWGMDMGGQAAGVFKGAGFENQNAHLEYKHTKIDKDGNATLDYDNFVKEAFEKKGSYPLSNMSAHTATQLANAYKQYSDPTNKSYSLEKANQVKAVAETFMQRGMGGQLGQDGDTPVMAPPGSPVAGAAARAEQQAASGVTPTVTDGTAVREVTAAPREFYGSGAGHVNQAFRELARVTGVIGAAPSGDINSSNAAVKADAPQKS